MEKILVGKLVGMSDPGQWSQVHVFVPEGGRKEVLGSLIVAVAVRQKESIDLAAFGQEIIQRVHEEYYGLETGNLVELKAVVERVGREFTQVEMEIAVGVVKEIGERKVFYAVGDGGGKVILWRQGQIFEIVTDGSASGWLEPGDVVVVGTKALFELIGMEEWRGVGSGDGGGGGERLAPLLVKGKA